MNRLSFLALLFLTLSLQADGLKKLVIGIPPWQDPHILHKVHQPLIKHMSEKLNIPIELLISRDYDDLIQRAKKHDVHLMFFTSNTYVKAKKQMNDIQYLATIQRRNKKGELKDHYRGVIAILHGSGIHTLDDLKGKRIGFTDYRSSSGYIYPMLLLYKHGFDSQKDFASIHMLKKHNKIIDGLMLKKIDAGATYGSMVDETNQKLPGTLRILAETQPIPFDAVAASPVIDEALAKTIQEILLSYKPASNMWDQVNFSKAAPQGFVVRDDAFYDVIRDANAMLKKIEQP